MDMNLIHGMKKEEKKKPIGRILSGNLRTARVEFTGEFRGEEGSLISFTHDKDLLYARVDKIESHRYAGLTGYIYFLEPLNQPARNMTEIFDADDDMENGILFIGQDRRGYDVRIHVNPLFDHTLICGMSRQGKTHLCIVLLEEMIMLNMPVLVIDSHGEFVNLAKKTDGWKHTENVVVVEELRIEDLISHLQQKKVVIYNLLGLPKVSKANRVGEILAQLHEAKEKDYAQANNQELLLQIPPVLVVLDEAEIYAPTKTSRWGVRGASLGAVMAIAKEGGKFGLGLIAVPQRLTMLDIDVRSQCNSAAIFRNTDIGSRVAIAKLSYIIQRDLRAMSGFVKGTCLMAGSFVRRVRTVYVRDLMSEKVKKVDFEKMLGIEAGPAPKLPMFQPRFVKTERGDIVDGETGEMVQGGMERLTQDDERAYEASEGDGVVLREEELPEAMMEELTKLSDKDLPFETHISDEDQTLLKKLRKGDDRKIG